MQRKEEIGCCSNQCRRGELRLEVIGGCYKIVEQEVKRVGGKYYTWYTLLVFDSELAILDVVYVGYI